MDWKAITKTVAPWIGTALGGPLGGLAVETVANALGLSEKSVDAVKQAIAGATPEQMLALKKADHEFELQMKALGFKQLADMQALEIEDRKDARAMQVITRSLMPAILSTVVTLGFFGILIGIMTGKLDVTSSPELLIMLGALGTAWTNQMNYWFGNTRASEFTTEMLAKADPIK